MIGYTYSVDTKNTIPVNQGDSIKGALAIGMIFGQIIFGSFGDAIGRHRIYGKELCC
jgi:PHS family inorganic phosphate transporter-like MFS transporter